MSTEKNYSLRKRDKLKQLRKAPTQIDWLTVQFRREGSRLNFKKEKQKLERELSVPLLENVLDEKKIILRCIEAGIYIYLDEKKVELQFQGTFFAHSLFPRNILLVNLRALSKFFGVPFYFSRLDISRDFYGFDIKELTRNFTRVDAVHNLGTMSFICGKNSSQVQTIQFRTEKRTLQFYRKDLELAAKKVGTDYHAEYSARHEAATGKKLGEQPWTRMALRIFNSAALTPFLRWFCDDSVTDDELLKKSLGHFFSKLYVKNPGQDSNRSRRKDCDYFSGMTLKDKAAKWPIVMGAVKKSDLKFTDVETYHLKKLESAVKSCLKRDIPVPTTQNEIVKLGLSDLAKFKTIPEDSPLLRYRKTYALLSKMQIGTKKLNRD